MHCPRFLLTIIFFAVASSLAAQEKDGFFLYEDSSRQLSPGAALQLFRDGKFNATPAGDNNKGFTRSVFWLAYMNPVDRPADSLLLSIGHNHINRIHFYYADSLPVLQWITGDHYPFAQRPILATGFYFPVQRKGLYLAKIDKANESLQLSFRTYAKTAALAMETRDKTTMAVFTGMLLLLVIFGLYLFIIEKERLYLYYILFISTGWLWVLSNAGYGFEYLWPDAPWFASKARPVFTLVPLIFSMLFLVHYIGGVKLRKIRIAIRILISLIAGSVVLIFFVTEKMHDTDVWLFLQYLIPLNPLFYIVISFGVLIVASWQGNRFAMFYLAANIVLLLSAVLQISFSFGSINRFGHFFSKYGLAVGYVAEAIIITAGLVYRFNRYRLDKEKLLVEMNRRQHENTRILMDVQEAERNHIANQLHDVAGSLLSAAKLNLSSLREKEWSNNRSTSLQLEKTEEAVGLVSDMVRNLSHALSPVMLAQVGFKTALEKVVSIFNVSDQINIHLVVIGFEEYKPAFNNYYTALYGIVYELLNNIVKHSRAKNALLQVMEYDDMFTILAEDDGIGLTGNATEKKPGLGMAGIESKINYFSGSIAFDKVTPSGLIITIEIPISNDAVQDNTGR
ncbi:hypothetical protein GWC95_19335 [Sediminibacterium roseum]|uniref:histidine kinase n=1 Tax=Sediminibacterium roseum TaxID=1978412 RepID=A0ABX0A0H5_9BACT|nr:7TM diverse intracellular signaling domain-containing protein [Sediminibacterium roseum]NCI52087.1 hypothetical protein [Sediminibacterium roseum]